MDAGNFPDLSNLSTVQFGECWDYLKNHPTIKQITEQEPKAEVLPWWKWLSSNFSLLCRSSRPYRYRSGCDASSEKQLLSAIAHCEFDNSDEMHNRMLFTVFRALLPEAADCPRYGPHWETIGFQGSDPSTDFRGVGVLGLVLPLSLVTTDATLIFARSALNFSRDPEKGFPFMVLSLNVTQIALTALKDGHLDKLTRAQGGALNALCRFYAGVLYFIYDKWRLENMTLVDSGYLLKRAEKTCKKDVNHCLECLEKYLAAHKSQPCDDKGPVKAAEEADPSQIWLDIPIS